MNDETKTESAQDDEGMNAEEAPQAAVDESGDEQAPETAAAAEPEQTTGFGESPPEDTEEDSSKLSAASEAAARAFFSKSDEETSEEAAEAAKAAAAEEVALAAFASKQGDEDNTPSISKEEIEEKRKAVAAKAAARAEKEDDEEDTEEVEPLIVDPPDDGIRRRWFAIHAHSGQEANVKRSILAQAEQEGLADMVTNVLVPMEQVEEFKTGGEKKVSKRKFFPGYVLIQLPEHPEKNPALWHLIKETSGVSGFIGSRTMPVPLEDSEVQAIVEEIRGERERPKRKVEFEESERVKIIDGPFANFLGNIDEINEDRGKLKVLVEIFERQTSVEVDYWQVEKI